MRGYGKPRNRRRHRKPGVTLASLGIALVILVIPLMQGGLIVQTLPALAFLVALAFLAESWRAMFRQSVSWKEVAPWILFWLAVTVFVFGQAAARELFDIEFDLNDNRFTRVFWLQHVRYWAFFTSYWLICWIVSRQYGRARDLLIVSIILMALFESLYGMIAFAGGQSTIIGIWPKERYFESVTGTFFNRNHLAGFLAVAMPLGASYLLSLRWDPACQRFPVIKISVTTMYLMITGGALIGTASRFGIFSAMSAFIIWVWLYIRTDLADSRYKWLWIGLTFSIPLLAGLWFGPDRLIERLLIIDQASSRIEIWRAMLAVPGEVWVYGIGAGSFHDVFKLIQPVGLIKSIWRAHNEYLQIGFEFGMIGIFLLVPFFVFWVKRCRPKSLGRIQRGALAGGLGIMIHNIADFDLQVPGTAVIFWVATGILFGSAPPARKISSKSNGYPGPRSAEVHSIGRRDRGRSRKNGDPTIAGT